MAKYRITSPDGQVFEITAPDGASEQQVLGYAKMQFARVKEAPRAPDPTEGMSTGEKFLAGAGKAFTDVGRGVRQLGAKVGLGDGAAIQAEIDEAKQRDAALMSTGAGIAGNITGGVAAALPAAFIPGVNSVVGSAAVGGAMGAMAPVASDESRLANTALGAAGGAGGQMVANTLSRAANPVKTRLSEPLKTLADKAESTYGIPLTVGQKTGSKPIQITESVLEKLPYTADKRAVMRETQRKAFNQAALRTIGEDANQATPEVLNAARVRIGRVFEELSARNAVGLDDEFVNALAKIDAGRNPFSTPKLDSLIEKGMELASKGQISGKDYQLVRSSLGKQAKGAFATDPELGQALKTVRGALDDAAGRTISDADKAAWTEARKQWQALKILEKAAAPTTADAVAGNVSPAKLASALKTADQKGFTFGTRGDALSDIARIGQAFVKESVPDSGTAQRMQYQALLTGAGGGLPLLAGVNPLAALGYAAATSATPLAMQKALTSPAGQKWLTQGMLGAQGQARLGALLRSGGLSGALAIGE
jgi:hypothetical protein